MAESGSRRQALTVGAACAAVLVVWAGAAVWLSAPGDGVCLAVWPAPRGCAPERLTFAAVWFVGLVVLAASSVASVRGIGSRGLAVGGVAALVLAAVSGYWLLWRV